MPNKADLHVINENPITDSICETCAHLVKRVIIPIDETDFGIDREELDIPEDENILYEHFFCSRMFMDIDHIVVTCNRYDKENKGSHLLINKNVL